MIFDSGILPDPKQHIIHALYIGFDESENEDERLAIERGLRAIVTFQEKVGEEPLKQIFNETQKIVEQISPNINNINQDHNNEDDELFKKMADLRDQELELHFNHLKIENIKE
jgi:hypothetical protein